MSHILGNTFAQSLPNDKRGSPNTLKKKEEEKKEKKKAKISGVEFQQKMARDIIG